MAYGGENDIESVAALIEKLMAKISRNGNGEANNAISNNGYRRKPIMKENGAMSSKTKPISILK